MTSLRVPAGGAPDARAPDARAPDARAAERARFIATTVAWLNRRLASAGVTVDARTPLFADGLLNSVRILELIAWTERAIGRTIPDESIRMDNFGTVERIGDVFVGGADGVGA